MHVPSEFRHGVDNLSEALDLVRRGVVRAVVDRTLPLDQSKAGLRALEEGQLIGKAVLVPGS
ncbi:MAG: zinc-binding dehydrogenase [Gemmatimonadota bacterium]